MAKYASSGIDTDARRRADGRPAHRGAGGPVRGHQGGGGGRRRARGRPADAPQLRPHPGPRPRGGGVRRRRRPDLRHGEAVAVGLVFAALLARRLGRIDDARVAPPPAGGRAASTCRPTCRRAPTPSGCSTFMGRDKKAHHDLTFVLDGPDGVEVVRGVDRGRRGRYPGGHGVDRPGVSRPRTRERRPGPAAVGAEPRPAGGARARGLRHGHPGRPRGRGHGGGRRARPRRSSTSSPTTRATWSRRSTAPAAAPRPSSSTPAP